MLWLYLHFPNLQLNSAFNAQPNTPIAIVEGKKSQIIQCNGTAKAQGISVGMGLGAAAALSAELQVYPYDQNLEEERLSAIARWLYLVTSDICLIKPQGILLRVSNMLSLYQNLPSYWQALEQHLAQLDIDYCYATGFSPYAAKILALNGTNQITDDAKLINKALSQCSLTLSDISVKQQEQLIRVGVHSLGELTQLPLADIAKRFDIDMVNYVGKLTGRLQHMVEFYHPPEQFHHYLELFFDISNTQQLTKPLSRLYRLLETFLRLRDKRASQLHLTLHQRDAAPVELTIDAAQGEYQANRWLELSELKLASVTLIAPVVGITLAVEQTMNHDEQMHDLFAGRQGQLSIQALVSRLQAKLGIEQVRGVYLVDDHRPEKATQYDQPLKTCEPEKLPLSELRPSLLYQTPQPLEEKIDIFHGPERIVSGWWDQEYVIRDYFIAKGKQGQWFWTFRTPEKQWYIHGVFS